ncbi:TetR/AcrR family transcriptional regulator [Streptomyces griseus]|uniref:TetR/AcrR family transcriptional regulator n=1 Tax=Streptomyces griseus TaxID=1911 RepID=UPI000D13F1E2|nr:TetR/AcrR family transcriptional regulator [Streptomyces griseus]
MAGTQADGRIARGNQTRQLILRRAVEIASVEGLAALSMGQLATELKLSKSGVFALFGSKEDLQLATIRTAVTLYTEHVVQPARDLPAGVGRLWTLCTAWLTYSRERVFPGGCFFYSVSAEFDAREGKVHDALAAARSDWLSYLERTAREAQLAGELADDADLPQLVFELVAFLELANAESVLHDDFTCYDKAAKAVLNRLRAHTTDPSLLPAHT